MFFVKNNQKYFMDIKTNSYNIHLKPDSMREVYYYTELKVKKTA